MMSTTNLIMAILISTSVVSCVNKTHQTKKEDDSKVVVIPTKENRAINNQFIWTDFEYFFDENKYSTGIKFYGPHKHLIGIYKDREKLKMLISEEDQAEVGESFKVIPEDNKKPKLLVTIWLSGQYHRYRIFNPSIATTEPVCEFQGEGDYPEKIAYKFKKDILYIQVQERLGQLKYLDCSFNQINRNVR